MTFSKNSRTVLWNAVIFLKSKHILGFLRLWKKIMSWSNWTSNHLKVKSTFALADENIMLTNKEVLDFTFKSNLNWVHLKYFAHQKMLLQRSNHHWKIYKCFSPLGKPFSSLESKLKLLFSCFKVTVNYKVRFNSQK